MSKLDDVHEIIDWKQIEKTLSHLYASKRGVPAYPHLMMFKILILQAWYNLSDEALEEPLARDLLFRQFIGLSLSEAVPDHSTIWRFRNLLHTENLLDSLLEQINNHLAKNSLIVVTGSVNIIDATVIEAKQCRSKKNQQGDNTQDPEAAWNVKTAADGKRKSTYGFKLHANTDEDGFIKKMTTTPGNVHDSQEFDHLLGDSRGQVYADGAYTHRAPVPIKTIGKSTKNHGFHHSRFSGGDKDGGPHRNHERRRRIPDRNFRRTGCITC